MYNWWMYIRAMFEEGYALDKNSFECTGDNEYGKCICIPCVAINYIANEIKFWEKQTNKKLTYGFIWEEGHKIYLVKRESSDWNKDIYDMKNQGNTEIDDANLCTINQTDFSYVKIRDYKELQKSFVEPGNILYPHLISVGEGKIEIEIYTITARDFRNEFLMEEYLSKLFRFLFFLHPLDGLKTLDRNMRDDKSKALKEYNKNLLDDYEQLIEGFQGLNETYGGADTIKILEQISAFVGLEVSNVYSYLQKSDDGGDIKATHEMFQKKMNDTLKLGALGVDSRISRLRQKYLQPD